MDTEINSQILWNEGGKAAIAIGLVPVAYSVISILLSGIKGGMAGAMAVSLLSIALWAGKLVACILLMKYFMKRLAAGYSGVTNKVTQRYGCIIALLSAIIVAGYSLLSLTVINPDTYKSVLDSYISASQMDSNTMDAVSGVLDRLPVIIFFTQLLYCFIFGYVLSLILSRDIPSNDPFDQGQAND